MYQHFIEKEGKWVTKPAYSFLLLALVLLAISGYTFLYGRNQAYGVIPFIFMLIAVMAAGRKVIFDPAKGTVSGSYFGLFTKEYAVRDFQKFEITRHLTYGTHSGTDINMVFNVDGKRKTIFLYERVRKTPKIQVMMDEAKQIMQQP